MGTAQGQVEDTSWTEQKRMGALSPGEDGDRPRKHSHFSTHINITRRYH